MSITGQISNSLRWVINSTGRILGYRNPITDDDVVAPLAALEQFVYIDSSMSSRAQTASIQLALDLVDIAGGGRVSVHAAAGATLTLDDWLRMGSSTELVFPEYLLITVPANNRNVPVFSRVIGSGAISSVGVTSQTGGYRVAPQMFVVGSLLEPATVWAYVDNASKTVTDIYIQNGGRGYHSAPTTVEFKGYPRSDVIGSSLARRPTITLSVSGGAVTGYVIVDAGANLFQTGWVPLRVKGGMHARLTAAIDTSGNLTGVTVANGGANYIATRTYQTLGGDAATVLSVGGNPNIRAPMITNKDWFNGNTDITVRGGIWDGNASGMDYAKTTTEFNGMGFLFISVDNLHLAPTEVRNQHRYNFHLFDCWNPRIEKHRCYNGFDDVHLTGPARWVDIEGMTGSTGDDMYTCTAMERTVIDFVAGDQNWITVSGVRPQGTSYLLAVWPGKREDGTVYRIDNIHMKDVKGVPMQLLLRCNNVEALNLSGGIGRIRLTEVELRGAENFTGSAPRTPAVTSLVQLNYVTVDELELDIQHYLGSSGTTVTPTFIEVNAGASIRSIKMNARVDWACAASTSLILYPTAAGTAPEHVKISGSYTMGADSGTGNYIANFSGTGKAPTKSIDISGIRASNIQLLGGLTAAVNYVNANGAYCYRANSSGADIAWSGTLHLSVQGAIFDGAHKVTAPISAGALNYWWGDPQLINSATVANSANQSFYPHSYAITISMTHTANTEKLSKTDGVYFTTSFSSAYGVPQASAMHVVKDFDGNFWFRSLTGESCMVPTIVSGGAGYAANDLLTITSNASCTGSATYDPPSLADGAGATTTVTVNGAALGDVATAAFSLDTQGITVTAWVSAANTVSVRFQNESGGVLDLASGTLTCKTIKTSGNTWRVPPIVKVLTVSGGVIQTAEMSYSGLWDGARPTGTLSVTGGAGTGATFTLAPL
jgi:hypothetical protein